MIYNDLDILTSSALAPLVPDLGDAILGLLVGVGLGSAGLVAVAEVHRRGVRTPDTRKLFHAWIFSIAGVLQLARDVGAVSAFGATVAALVLYTVARGDGFGPYEALARQTDAPRRGLFVVVPLCMTALGGVLANLLFPATAMIGYWVTGWGDAVGEPVGVRWGKRRYSVPSLAGVPAQRSLEGSTAVFFASFVVAGVGLVLLSGEMPVQAWLWKTAVVALGGTLVEAVSNHGTDNLTMQLAAAGLAAWVIGL